MFILLFLFLSRNNLGVFSSLIYSQLLTDSFKFLYYSSYHSHYRSLRAHHRWLTSTTLRRDGWTWHRAKDTRWHPGRLSWLQDCHLERTHGCVLTQMLSVAPVIRISMIISYLSLSSFSPLAHVLHTFLLKTLQLSFPIATLLPSHTHSHTSTLSLSHTHTLYLSLSLSHPIPHSHTLYLSQPLSLSLSL